MSGTRMRKRLLFITTCDTGRLPHPDVMLWALATHGWEITSVTVTPENSLVRDVFRVRWRTRSLPGGDARRAAREIAIAWELLKARFGPYDVIYIHSQGLGYRAGLTFLGPLFRKRVVYHNPDYYDPVRYPVRTALEGIMARKCHLHINGEYHRAYILRAQHRMNSPAVIVPPSLPAAWPIPPPSEAVRRELTGGLPGDCFVLRLQGAFSHLRMVPELFEAVRLLPTRFRLAMTRDRAATANENTEQILHKLGIAERVLRLPHMPFGEMLRYTANADAGVLLYANNDLGNFFQSPERLAHYLACGLPVLASRFTGLENLVLKYSIGHCVDSSDPKSIAEAALRLEADVKSGRLAKHTIRRRFEECFAFEHWIPQLIQAFDDLLVDGLSRQRGQPPAVGFPLMPHNGSHAAPPDYSPRVAQY